MDFNIPDKSYSSRISTITRSPHGFAGGIYQIQTFIIMFKYLNGSPKQYRFNGQTGQFNINGDRPILDANGKSAQSFTCQPVAYRVFDEYLFGRQKSELWVELFFLDEAKTIGSIMFNNSSANQFVSLLQELFYDDKELTDCILTIRPESKTNTKGSWFLANFSVVDADPEVTEDLKKFDDEFKINQTSSITKTASYRLYKGAFFSEFVPKLIEEHERKALDLIENI